MNEQLKNAIDNYGQANLARDAEISKSTVSLVRSGQRHFGKKKAKRISELLDVPLAVALGID